jgi:hypothetical protein
MRDFFLVILKKNTNIVVFIRNNDYVYNVKLKL